MLVYANFIELNPRNGPSDVIKLIARWTGQRAQGFVDPERLQTGIRELRLNDGSTLSSISNEVATKNLSFPYLFCAKLSHSDGSVSGRRWVTEIGLRRNDEKSITECSFLLKTDEVSALVTTPIQVTRPKLVQLVLEECQPAPNTAGLSLKMLDGNQSSRAFVHEVERSNRRYPIVLVSASKDGEYACTPERLQQVLAGLAAVVKIPPETDTYAIEKLLGRRYMAFGGAINILFPVRQNGLNLPVETVLLQASELYAFQDDGRKIESEVLAAVTHRTNLPYSWRHISMEAVSQSILRARLTMAVDDARSSEESAVYAELLTQASAEIKNGEEERNRLRDSLEDANEAIHRLDAKSRSLEYAKNDIETQHAEKMVAPFRGALIAAFKGEITLESALEIVRLVYPGRLEILDSAIDSARESDKRKFRHSKEALLLLLKLAGDYWKALENGRSDQQAKATFGHNEYAQNEGSALTTEGERRRTFQYRDKSLFMQKHLKHGVKDSAAETLRIHFDWIADEQKIVIGHCGKHLDF